MPFAQTSLAALLLLLALVSDASAKGESKTWDRAVLSDGPSYRSNLCATSKKYAPRQHNPPPPSAAKPQP